MRSAEAPLALALPQSLGATRLRCLRTSDRPAFAAYRADPLLARYQSWEPMSEEAASAFLRATANATHLEPDGWIQLAIAAADTDEVIGDVGLYVSADLTRSEIGFTLARPYHGRGHASRAIELAVQQAFVVVPTVLEVTAVTDERNRASVAVLRRTGFVQTGTREAIFKRMPCVELLFARPRDPLPGSHARQGRPDPSLERSVDASDPHAHPAS